MNKRLMAVMAGLVFVFFALSTASAQQLLRLSHNAAPGNPKSVGSLRFAELVAEKTGGRIKVEVGGSAQFGDDVESLTNMRLGSLAFSANSQGPVSSIVPQFGVIGLPFLFRDLEHAYRVVDGAVGRQLGELAKAKGLVVLALWDNGIRHVSNSKRPILRPEDLAGLKLRTPQDPMTIDIFSALGANPTPLAFSELYIALQQGVVDGQENPLMNIHSSKLHEVQKYITLTGHKYETTPLLASRKVWDGLSRDDQVAILAAAAEAGRLNRRMTGDSDAELRAKLSGAGVRFNEVDKAPFVARTQTVYDKWSRQYPDLVKAIVAEAAK